MKSILTIKESFYKVVASWIFKIIVIATIAFLYIRIYTINPFFVIIMSGILSLPLIGGTVKVILFSDKFIIKSYWFFDIFYSNKVIHIKEIKGIVIAGNYTSSSLFYDLLIPYANSKRSNEIRVIYHNGDVKIFTIGIYLNDLTLFEKELNKLLNSNKPPISQPISREE